MKCNIARCAIALAVGAVVSRPAFGTTYTWLPTTGGLFNTPGNWSPSGPPSTTSDTAIYPSTASQVIIFETNQTIASHRIENGNITFQLNRTIQTMNPGAGLIVGNTANQTGRLTIVNGTLTGDMSLGNVDASIGFFTIGTDGIFDAGTNITAVGSQGIATMTVSANGRFINPNGLLIGDQTGSNGSVVVNGADASLMTNTGAILVGNSSVGALTITAGSVSGPAISMGNNAAGIGTLTVSGPDSTVLSNSGTFLVGDLGKGTADISGGAHVTSQTSQIAAGNAAAGTATVSGAGTTWTAASLAVGGQFGINGGTGTLVVKDSAVINISGNMDIRNSTSTSVTIDGGVVNVGGSFTKLGTLNLLDGTLHVSGTFDNGAAAASLNIDGATADALPALRLSGFPGVTNHVTSVTVGSVNRGVLIVDSRRLLSLTNPVSIGATATGNGSVTVTGSSSTLATTGTISVGGTAGGAQGIGALTVSQNGTVTAGTLNLFPQSTLTIDNGTLNAAAISISAGATANFLRGRVNLNGNPENLTATVLDTLLGTTHELGAGQSIGGGEFTLTLQTPLTINGGMLTSGSGGFFTNSSTLILNAGTLNSDAVLTNDAGKTIVVSGTGAILTPSSFTNNGALVLSNNFVPTSGGLITNFGVIRGTGIIANNLTNPTAGQVQITTGNRLELTASSISNAGIVSVDGGELVLDVGMNNITNGLISGRNGIVRGGTSGITNTGAIAFSGSSMDVYGDVTQQAGGKITITGGGVTTFYDDVTISPGAANVQVSSTGGVVSSVVFLGSYNGGTTGGGAAFIEGDHRPGNSPAIVSFGGDLFYGEGAHLNIELGGTTAGSQFDQVQVAGSAFLSGQLNLSLINGYNPAYLLKHKILTAANRIDRFDQVSGVLASSTKGLAVTYEGNDVFVTAALPGDANLDGKVNAIDFNILASHFGQSGQVWTTADFTGEGVVNTPDFTALAMNFNVSVLPGPVVEVASVVPEPALIGLASMGATVLYRRRRGKGAF